MCIFRTLPAEAPIDGWQILQQHCVRCHNPDTTRGGLDLSTHESAMYGGVTMQTIVPGKPEESELWKRVRDGSMPPERDARPLNAVEQAALKLWIEQGAKPPAIQSPSALKHPIQAAAEPVVLPSVHYHYFPSIRRFPRRRNCR